MSFFFYFGERIMYELERKRWYPAFHAGFRCLLLCQFWLPFCTVLIWYFCCRLILNSALNQNWYKVVAVLIDLSICFHLFSLLYLLLLPFNFCIRHRKELHWFSLPFPFTIFWLKSVYLVCKFSFIYLHVLSSLLEFLNC